jgi:hypothetical protein
MLSDSAGFLGRATGVPLQNRPGQGGHEFTVVFLTRQHRAAAGSSARRHLSRPGKSTPLVVCAGL